MKYNDEGRWQHPELTGHQIISTHFRIFYSPLSIKGQMLVKQNYVMKQQTKYLTMSKRFLLKSRKLREI
jgi:hypothetical protein